MRYSIFSNQTNIDSEDRAHMALMEKMKTDQSYVSRLESAEVKFDPKPEILQSSIVINRLTGMSDDQPPFSDENKKNQPRNFSSSTIVMTNKKVSQLYEDVVKAVLQEKQRFFSEIGTSSSKSNYLESKSLGSSIGVNVSNYSGNSSQIHLSKEIQQNLFPIPEKSEMNDGSYLLVENSNAEISSSSKIKPDLGKKENFDFFFNLFTPIVSCLIL